MTVLIVYSTNSGSTAAAAEVVSATLKEKGHTVTVKQALKTTPQELPNYDLLVFGSPSWDYQGKEGQPHEDITKLLSQLDSVKLAGKKYAIFGLGDTSYTAFCGANVIMESILNGKGLTKAVDSLKIDRYYTNPTAAEDVKRWASTISLLLSLLDATA